MELTPGTISVESTITINGGTGLFDYLKSLIPEKIGEFTLAFSFKGCEVGTWHRLAFGMKSGEVVEYDGLFERIQPSDGDGPGFTVVGVYERTGG